jgi:peptide/nickel transport system permease protein
MSDRTAQQPFEARSEHEVTWSDKARQWFDLWVYSPFSIIWEDIRTRLSLSIIALYLLMGTIGVMIVQPPSLNEGPRLVQPFVSLDYPFGTTSFGRDLFALIVHSTPAMLKMITSGAVFATSVAVIMGTVSGYKRGLIDSVVMTITDVAMVIPGLPLIIVISIAFPPKNPFMVGIILSINAWAGLARSIRSEVLTIREESYVEASSIMGIPTSSIIMKDILPNIMPYVLVNFMQSARRVIFASVGLYFLGLLPYTTLNWGVILNRAYTQGGLTSDKAAHWLVFPILTIGLLTFSLVLFAQGLDRVFSPRIRARHSRTVDDEGPELE